MIHWSKTQFTYIWVFNTGRGLSVAVRLPNNIGMLYDLGASDEFSPADFFSKHIAPFLQAYEKKKLAQLFMSHPHADHIAEVEKVKSNSALDAALVTCPNEKDSSEAVDWSRLEREDNRELLSHYKSIYGSRKPPLQTLDKQKLGSVSPNVEYGLYYMNPLAVGDEHPSNDQHYGNGLSLVVYLRHGKNSILIPGDVTPEVMRKILNGGPGIEKRYSYLWSSPAGTPGDFHHRTSSQPTLKTLLKEQWLTILVTPHHGLESCYCEELFNAMRGGKTVLNVISEKRHTGENDGKIHPRYQSESGAFGCPVNDDGEDRDAFSVSTRNGQHILIVLESTRERPRGVYLRKNPYDLLKV